MEKKSVASLLDGIRGRKVLVAGDIMLDEYLWGSVERISPEAPVPVVKVEKQTFALGGASNVASNARTLGAQPVLMGVVGKDEPGRRIRTLLRKKGMDDRAIFADGSRSTIVKKRVVAHHQQVVRVDFDEASPVGRRMEKRMLRFLEDHCGSICSIILEDYNKGTLTRPVIRGIISFARKKKIPVTVDPKFEHFFDYEGVTLLKPNIRELERVTGKVLADERAIVRILRSIQRRMGVQAMLLTLGEQGMTLVEKGKQPFSIEPHAHDVYDVTGAGDTVITAVTLALVAGANLREAALFASMAAAIEVTKLGAAPVHPEELLGFAEQYGR